MVIWYRVFLFNRNNLQLLSTKIHGNSLEIDYRVITHSVMANVLDYNLEVSLNSSHAIIPHGYVFNSITAAFPQG